MLALHLMLSGTYVLCSKYAGWVGSQFLDDFFRWALISGQCSYEVDASIEVNLRFIHMYFPDMTSQGYWVGVKGAVTSMKAQVRLLFP